MLIRFAEEKDIITWLKLSNEYDIYITDMGLSLDAWYDFGGFADYMKSKIKKHNALIAEDRMTEKCLGMLAFSKTKNSISFFAVSHNAYFDTVAHRLHLTALRQLDSSKDISTKVLDNETGIYKKIFDFYNKNGFIADDEILIENDIPFRVLNRRAAFEKHGRSFHFDYDRYHKHSEEIYCRPCNAAPMPDDQQDIAELKYSYICGQREAQGRLFGKLYVMPKTHAVNFEDMEHEAMTGFMKEVQIAGKALRKVTGAIKINYEMHANSCPHLHIHLFPRYLDDDFPSAPIDYRICEPSPYESDEEYDWFVERMRKEIENSVNKY